MKRHRILEPARRLGVIVAVLAAVVAASLGVASPAGAAQTGGDDPYGGTSTTEGNPEVDPACQVEVTSAAAGAGLSATVTGVPFGATVEILVGGIESGSATAPSESQEGTTALDVPFRVPDLEPGTYELTAVGVDFTVACADDGLDVIGSGQRAGDGGDGGALAFTGFNLLLLVLLAAALIGTGWYLRRRRRGAHT